jgi:nucleoside-triphosphatase THEP1
VSRLAELLDEAGVQVSGFLTRECARAARRMPEEVAERLRAGI